jgi:eukaryotic-like serine/threonine-protein kinase
LKILDFGLAGLAPHIGTAAYMSPEMVQGMETDGRTDLFSLGAVMFELATGRQAYKENTASAVYDGLSDGSHYWPKAAKLQEIIHKLLKEDRDARYQTAAELLADLKCCEKM